MAKLEKPIIESEAPKSDRNFDPLPPGWYSVRITESTVKDTNAGTGNYLKLRYDVVADPGAGRVIFGNLNLRNPNPEAERIGAQQMGELLRAVGMARLDDSDQLIGKTLDVKVNIRVSEQYGDSNDVKAFRSNGSKPAAGGTSAPAASTAKKPPWAKS
jgi:hypothetical protein